MMRFSFALVGWIVLQTVFGRGIAAEPIVVADAQVSLIQNTFIAAPISGVVAEVLVSEGDHVVAGHRMVQLDNEQVRREWEAAEAAFYAARMEADNDIDARYAKRTMEVRSRELQQSQDANRGFAGAISATEIAKLQLVVDQAKLSIEQAEHELKVAEAVAVEKAAAAKIVKARMDKHGIQAPVAGQVAEVAVEAGEWVEAGKPVVRLIALDPIRVECFVDGQNHGSELVGRSIKFYPANSPNGEKVKPLIGKVTYVSPELHPVTGQARLWATVDNSKQIGRAGMRGRLEIESAK
ncbi:putative efflux pump membrane fusion protein [Rubripirellula tenax]|uniref:Putative efflux pump membrane fusion protein n=1 Tax=Rubripirellula tenax TaxID=2528015 RepID=A0A5C6EPN1_9BACT|nr:HlyD family efflux transporter periplasmic adaptor subunit [Rubripirellula tenax]TWU51062.1 putative efflux pump membrane fusion protein [Rubripirellula tenax]